MARKISLRNELLCGTVPVWDISSEIAERLFGSKYDIQSKIEIQDTITYSIEKWKKKTWELDSRYSIS